MKKIIYIVSLTLSLAFLGCSSEPIDSSATALELGVKTEVKSGDIYKAVSKDALVTFEHNLTTNIRYITLTHGEGELVTAIEQ